MYLVLGSEFTHTETDREAGGDRLCGENRERGNIHLLVIREH